MPEDLLQELETTAPVAGSFHSIEDLVQEALRHAAQVGLAVEGMRGSALAFENIWRRIVMDVARGHTAEMQAARPRVLSAFEKRLVLLKQTQLVASWLRELSSADVPDPEFLLSEIAGMERLKGNVFDLWQTADNLVDLAARDYPLTTVELDQIGPSRRPPAAYYEEESQPF
jgi:hypothetical protein